MTTTRRHRPRHTHPTPPEPLTLALKALNNAVADLCDPQPHHLPTGPLAWLDSRYQQLRDSIPGAGLAGHKRRTAPHEIVPFQIDYTMLAMRIDTRAQALHPAGTNTPDRLRSYATHRYRPQDTHQLDTVTTEITAWVKAIDDLMAAPPLYLPDPCPHCGHTYAYRYHDDGQRIRTPGALALTVEYGAQCLHCHDTWPPDRLGILARMLGYHPLPGMATA
jgi:hypothetical protein